MSEKEGCFTGRVVGPFDHLKSHGWDARDGQGHKYVHTGFGREDSGEVIARRCCDGKMVVFGGGQWSIMALSDEDNPLPFRPASQIDEEQSSAPCSACAEVEGEGP